MKLHVFNLQWIHGYYINNIFVDFEVFLSSVMRINICISWPTAILILLPINTIIMYCHTFKRPVLDEYQSVYT